MPGDQPEMYSTDPIPNTPRIDANWEDWNWKSQTRCSSCSSCLELAQCLHTRYCVLELPVLPYLHISRRGWSVTRIASDCALSPRRPPPTPTLTRAGPVLVRHERPDRARRLRRTSRGGSTLCVLCVSLCYVLCATAYQLGPGGRGLGGAGGVRRGASSALYYSRDRDVGTHISIRGRSENISIRVISPIPIAQFRRLINGDGAARPLVPRAAPRPAARGRAGAALEASRGSRHPCARSPSRAATGRRRALRQGRRPARAVLRVAQRRHAAARRDAGGSGRRAGRRPLGAPPLAAVHRRPRLERHRRAAGRRAVWQVHGDRCVDTKYLATPM
eukprot:scaffold10219_cov59-Phaeocystis_antarctica.AAC.2